MRRSTTTVSRQKTHTTVFSFSLPPQTSQPLFARALEFPRRLRRLAKTNAAREFMPGRSKSTRAAPVETSSALNQVLDAIHRFTEMRHGLLENGGAQGHLQQRPVEAI